MLFNFIRYIDTSWYYNLKPFNGFCYWIDYTKLDPRLAARLDLCDHYSSMEAQLNDAAFQLWGMGHIITNKELLMPEVTTIHNVCDNYVFLRRHYHAYWSLYVLFLRLLTFCNPFKELVGYYKAKGIPKALVDMDSSIYQSVSSGVSALELSQPLISIIIPTLNRYHYLKDILKDLEAQTYTNFEVVVCDQSDEFDQSIYQGRKLQLKVIRQQEKALWLARNQCIKAAKGDYIAFSEDDVRVEPNWLVQHLRCMDGFGVDISAGVFYPEGSEIPSDRSSYHWADQFATGNALIKRSVFEKTGLFDRQFERMRSGDGEFGARCYLNGFLSVSNPFACCVDVKAPTGGLRQMGSWDSFRPTRFFAPRPVPSILYYVRKYYGDPQAVFLLLRSLPGMLLPYRYRNSKKMLPLSLLAAMVLFPILAVQITLSWRKSSLMLCQGARIEPLNP